MRANGQDSIVDVAPRDMMQEIMLRKVFLAVLLPLACFAQTPNASEAKPLRLAIAGLVHSHVDGFLRGVRNRTDVQIVGVFEPDTAVQHKYAEKYNLGKLPFFTDLGTMLDSVKPEAVATFTSTYDHPVIVEECASRHIPVMMEKPLAVSMDHAQAIRRAADGAGIPVIVNYYTTRNRSHAPIAEVVKTQRAGEDIR